jgi:hypothetical protein
MLFITSPQKFKVPVAGTIFYPQISPVQSVKKRPSVTYGYFALPSLDKKYCINNVLGASLHLAHLNMMPFVSADYI